MPEQEKEGLRKLMVFLSKMRIAKGLLRLVFLFPKVKKLFQVGAVEIFTSGQSHLDTCWLWNWDTTRNKIKATFGNAIKRLPKYKGYVFSAPAPVHYEFIEKNEPEIFDQIKELVKQGKWEPVGGMWVESDLIVPCGESLVRQRLHGMRYFKERFDFMPRVAWTPDVFGFPWSLPQIYKKSGADYFYTTKLTWNTKNQFPFPVFHWQSPDGSSIIALNWYYGINKSAFISKFPEQAKLLQEGLSAGSRTFSYADKVDRDSLLDSGKFTEDYIREYFFCYGQGDGGHGPYETEIIIVDNLVRLKRGSHTRVHDYFDFLQAYNERLPIWNDECYLEVHRGCPTTHNDIKQLNRRCEELLLTSEKMAAIASVHGFPYPSLKFKESWKKLLFNQFHDILPGSSIQHVYYGPGSKYSLKDYAEIQDEMRTIQSGVAIFFSRTFASLRNSRFIVFFPTQWCGPALVSLPLEGDGGDDKIHANGRAFMINIQEKSLTGQISENICKDGASVQFIIQKGEGIMLQALNGIEPSKEFALDGSKLILDEGDAFSYENEHYKVKISKSWGYMTSLVEKSTKREINGGRLNVLRTFSDMPNGNDAWNIDEAYRSKPIDVFTVEEVIVVDDGPVFSRIRVHARSEASSYNLYYSFYRELPWIVCDLEVDWHEQHVFLRTEFETTIQAKKITTGIPFAHIDRPVAPSSPRQEAMYEFHGQKWVSMSDGACGLSVFNKARYGFSVDNHDFGMSLLRSPSYPRTNTRYPEMEYPERLMQFTDQGMNHVAWTIMPHAGDWKQASIVKHAHCFNHEPIVMMVEEKEEDKGDTSINGNGIDHQGSNVPARTLPLITVDKENVMVAAVKMGYVDDEVLDAGGRASGWIVVRLIERHGMKTEVSIQLVGLKTIMECTETNLLELSMISKVPFKNVMVGPIVMMPHEIKTLKIRVE
ncbi:MAG: alpha-mannosidase [Promethearchaeota archaeon]